MTGIPSVNNLPFWYQLVTLIILGGLAIYDYRYHLVKDIALFLLLPWCTLPMITSLFSEPIAYFIGILCSALLGFLAGGLLLLSASMITGGGLGGGDIKLAAILGFIYGPSLILSILTLSSLYAMTGLLLKGLLKQDKKESIPFVPYLFLGALSIWLLC